MPGGAPQRDLWAQHGENQRQLLQKALSSDSRPLVVVIDGKGSKRTAAKVRKLVAAVFVGATAFAAAVSFASMFLRRGNRWRSEVCAKKSFTSVPFHNTQSTTRMIPKVRIFTWIRAVPPRVRASCDRSNLSRSGGGSCPGSTWKGRSGGSCYGASPSPLGSTTNGAERRQLWVPFLVLYRKVNF